MTKHLKKNNLPQLITVIINLLLFVAVIILMNFVQSSLKSDSKITLTEVVTQNKDVITSKLNLEMNNVKNISKSIALNLQGKEINETTLYECLQSISIINEEERVFASLPNGQAIFLHEDTINISGRNYFRTSMKGNPNISNKIIARTDGSDVFIISVPIEIDNTIVGTVQRFYSVKEMYELCSLSLFSSKGTMNIVNKDGYILISSQSDKYNTEMDNYLRVLYEEGNVEQSKKLEKHIQQNKEGFLEVDINNEASFMSFTPIEGIHDWFLVTSVAENAISPNGSIVVRMFYIIFVVIVIVFGTSMFYFIYFKNKQQANLEHLAFVDTITKGASYTKFQVDFHEILNRCNDDTFYLLKFDIDNFKYINNYYSFELGDKILYQIYHAIHAKLYEDECISRISSDHFIVLLRNDASEERLKRMMETVESEEGIQIYFSSGVYKIHNRQEPIALMVDRAGVAASASKGSLVKKVGIYSEEFENKMIHNEQLKRSIKEALKQHEILPFYQPKVDVNTNMVVGAEALARWIKKDGTRIFPDEFIPVCEQSGLIIELDMLIFEDVLKFQRNRILQGLHCVTISVNFSRNHLFDKDFIPKLSKLMKEYQIPMNLVEIEITESAFFNNMNIMNEFVEALHKQGFMVSMDDFGSGYSSLNMLKDIQIDVLKIDREFLIGTENSEKQKIIFAAISRMAKELNIKVVVEGVETLDNVEMMKAYGCTIAQGYFYAKPMPEDDFEAFLKED